MGNTKHPEHLGSLIDAVLAEIPNLTAQEHLRQLPKSLRNKLYHHAKFNPPRKTLDFYVGIAEKDRAALKKGSADMAERLSAFSEIGKRLMEAANLARAHLAPFVPQVREIWEGRIERATVLATTDKLATNEHVDLLVMLSNFHAAEQREAEVLHQIHGFDEPDDQEDYGPEPEDYPDPDYEPPEDYPEPDYQDFVEPEEFAPEEHPGDYAPSEELEPGESMVLEHHDEEADEMHLGEEPPEGHPEPAIDPDEESTD